MRQVFCWLLQLTGMYAVDQSFTRPAVMMAME